MSRQHLNPYIVTDTSTYQLVKSNHTFNEDWLQNFIFNHPQSIPVLEIEPIFAPLIPVCRELPTAAGPLDNVFINSAGLLTFVECKLWKNPEARREVIGQILDYAKEISRWSYDDLQQAINKSLFRPNKALYDLVVETNGEVEEADFIDNVSRNLKRGRFLLLIIGDGIKESVELISEFLQNYAHLNFGFSLVEMGIFELPVSMGHGYVVHPRIIARTVEIERAVVRIEDGKITIEAPQEVRKGMPAQRTQISEQAFYENVQVKSEVLQDLKAFLEKAKNIGLIVEPGTNSLKLKSNLYDLNFGIFRTVGEFWNCGIASTTSDLGFPQIGEHYLDQLAALFPSGYILKTANPFYWTVKIRDGNRYLRIEECLDVQDEWLNIIQRTLDELAQILDRTSKTVE